MARSRPRVDRAAREPGWRSSLRAWPRQRRRRESRPSAREHARGRALGRVFTEYQPDVVLDCHEFGVKTRWLEKFGGLQRHDALIQYATVSNLPPALTDAAEKLFRQPLVKALDNAGLTQSWYYTSSYDPYDKVVSMG